MGTFTAKVISEEISFKHNGDELTASTDRGEKKKHPICMNSLSSERASLGVECKGRMSTRLASYDEVMHLVFFFFKIQPNYKPRAISSVLKIRKADVFSDDILSRG